MVVYNLSLSPLTYTYILKPLLFIPSRDTTGRQKYPFLQIDIPDWKSCSQSQFYISVDDKSFFV
jgi:hypothetical protein